MVDDMNPDLSLEHSMSYDYYPNVLWFCCCFYTKFFLHCSSFCPDISVKMINTMWILDAVQQTEKLKKEKLYLDLYNKY